MFAKGFCNFANLTIIWLNQKYGGLASLDESTQKLRGEFGGLMEYLLGVRRCRLVVANSFGVEAFNGTHRIYTDAIKLIYEKVNLQLELDFELASPN